MNSHYLFKSERLGFRNWKEEDIPKMAAISADETVMEFFPYVATHQQTSEFVIRMMNDFTNKGYCYFAVDELETGAFIGFIGCLDQNYDVDFMPNTDIGWRLSPNYWGKGYATEGAKSCLNYMFENNLAEYIISTTPTLNIRSESVMQKIGMTKVKQFNHPKIEVTDPLNECVLYKIEK